MNCNPAIDISTPIAEIIEAKIKFHKEQIELHQSEINSLRQYDSYRQKVVSDAPSLNQLGYEKSKNDGKLFFELEGVELEISQKHIRPLVTSLFNKNPDKPLHTQLIYETFVQEGLTGNNNTNEYASKWKTAISLSLDAMNTVKTIVETGEKIGRAKVYVLNPPKTEHLDYSINIKTAELSAVQ